MTPEFEKLMAILGEVAPNIDTASVTPSSNLTADLGLNSLSIMLLAMSIEDAYGFEFDDDANFETVQDVCDYVKAHKKTN